MRYGRGMFSKLPYLLAALSLAAPLAAAASTPPPGAEAALARGEAQELIVEFDSRAVEQAASALRIRRGIAHDDAEVLTLRKEGYRRVKDTVRTTLPSAEHETTADFSALPLTLMRVRTPRALAALAGHRQVVGIYRNAVKFPIPDNVPLLDSQSQAMIGAPAAGVAGLTGAGTTVLVIDTGANYTVADLGSCTAPASPASCRVSKALYVNAGNHVVADPYSPGSSYNDHGTNVASIVAGVASATQVAVINVIGSSGTTTDAKILAAINWGISNQAAYNIRALNLSLGDGVRNTVACGASPYASAFSTVRAFGIVPAVASGNNAYLDGISGPACAPGAVSVGAVYVTNYGGLAWSQCTDYTTAADKVTCFSNSASFLTMLAPGALITAGGKTFGGTSQAAPFVAATAALLYPAYPDDTVTARIERLTGGAAPVADARNAQVTPRLDLAAIAVAYTASVDVPTLPEWAAILLGGVLLLGATRRPA